MYFKHLNIRPPRGENKREKDFICTISIEVKRQFYRHALRVFFFIYRIITLNKSCTMNWRTKRLYPDNDIFGLPPINCEFIDFPSKF